MRVRTHIAAQNAPDIHFTMFRHEKGPVFLLQIHKVFVHLLALENLSYIR